jgi:hypothetical protein
LGTASAGWSKVIAGVLKAVALAGLALCLVEPMLSGTRARRGANMFAIVADNSQSMRVHDPGSAQSRGEVMQNLLAAESNWQQRLAEDFEARRFAFDAHLKSIEDFSGLTFNGRRSSLNGTLNSLSRRFRGLPLAGVLLVTDGNGTDAGELQWNNLPPIYPVIVGADVSPVDLSVTDVTASQTNFESAPVVVRASVGRSGFAGESVVAALFDENGKEIETQDLQIPESEEPLALRFELRPEKKGVSFYRVKLSTRAHTGDEPNDEAQGQEATLANNERLVVVDRGGGPYRVLYVCGRPNWEFKFLRRAIADDDQLELVGLVRIARREPKFSFRSKAGESTNPLFRGFEHEDEESAERYDQPVLVRLGTKDERELRDGFPKTAAELYQYDAIVIDDVEAGFFTHDQLALMKNFVSRRGGGLIMLGGPDSFAAGNYARTPAGNLLPVYVDQDARPDGDASGHEYRLALTREGWLQPWVRTRETEPEERARLSSMATFQSLSRVAHIKPAATVLAEVRDETGARHPALVTQRFGRGRSAALLIGDFWRWGMKRKDDKESDLEKSWRQMVRWLLADVPRRVELAAEPVEDSEAGAVNLVVRARDSEYLPLDNAQVSLEVVTPDGKKIALDAEPSDEEPGAYTAAHVPRLPGAYWAQVTVKAPDGSDLGSSEAGWVAQPDAEEFASLRPNRARLQQIAAQTGGEVIEAGQLNDFVGSLPARKAPITEPWIRPAWHHPLFYLAIIGCLCAEWGLRRWKGLA